jgi:hypothetical protein
MSKELPLAFILCTSIACCPGGGTGGAAMDDDVSATLVGRLSSPSP